MTLFCSDCSRNWTLSPERWRCDCGSPLIWQPRDDILLNAIDTYDWTIWRYMAMLGLPDGVSPVSLGEGMTPLLQTYDGQSWMKLEYINPTGSFKDRGASVLVTALRSWGIRKVVEDSSGNAGVALSAYAKQVNIHCQIFVPQTSSAGKLSALYLFNADVKFCSTRQEAMELALSSERDGIFYASHTWNPLYLQGTKTIAYELAEQLKWKVTNKFSIFVPVGNGDLLLGLYLGFKELVLSGLTESMPRLFAVQAQACAPIYSEAYGLSLPISDTIAEGVAVANPPRLRQIIFAVQTTEGDILAVSESAILNATDQLANIGIWVEPTGALAWAGWTQMGKPFHSVILLTGAGWKTLRP